PAASAVYWPSRLSGLGCRLVLIDISTGVDDVAAECRSAGSPKVQAYQCDLSSREAIYATCERLLAEFGQRVDILVNNAGVVTGRPFLDCPDAMIRRTMAVNIEAHFWLCKALLPGMIERNCGHIVTVASGAGQSLTSTDQCSPTMLTPQLGVPSLSDYCASKFAAVGFDESLKFELASRGNGGVRTTCVCPYYINTGMFDGVPLPPRLLPVMDPDYVIDKMVQAILTNQELLVLPRLLYYTNIIH
uniref:RDH8 dehydrogenase n=1 Tax=Macrostomum lignano TaxID=282301 RepID=A0A1I8HPE8_9PLAT